MRVGARFAGRRPLDGRVRRLRARPWTGFHVLPHLADSGTSLRGVTTLDRPSIESSATLFRNRGKRLVSKRYSTQSHMRERTPSGPRAVGGIRSAGSRSLLPLAFGLLLAG
jgi:hypothetical protein